ncbi:MAG: thiol-disulfide isomerase [Acidobacteriaceae bacterium]|nr:thiol-disulfide isomerase [Acidobacteriaceae bacterium]MBV9443925.1 thiol-disulfide isomerase [Acidobacteriaceae bacterium]
MKFLLLFTAVFSLAAETPTFYRDVLPILQSRCQGCHRRGELAPMPLQTYRDVRPYAAAIREVTARKLMPPWFADPCCGHFANDPTLSAQQPATLSAWADAHAPEGDPHDAPPAPFFAEGWNISPPDLVLRMPVPKQIPASGDVPYQYIIIRTGFKQDRWVRMSEIRPSNRTVVHHAVAYIREPGSKWLRGAPVGTPFSADDLSDPALRRDAMWTASDILLVYAPGSSPDTWPEGFSKLVPAGSDIVLQMHYTTRGVPMQDQTSIGLVFAKTQPTKRVITLQLTNDHFLIPPGDPDHRAEVHGTLPNDALLLSFFPHMHLRGKTFEYNVRQPGSHMQTLLRIPHYDFYWQLSYRFAQPLPLKAGTLLQAVATFDNSRNNPHNPDPDSAVTWGEQTWAEMMVGFFDVAIDPSVDKQAFFIRKSGERTPPAQRIGGRQP